MDASALASTAAPSAPHILFFLVDDMGFNDIGYNSIDLPHATPFLRCKQQGQPFLEHDGLLAINSHKPMGFAASDPPTVASPRIFVECVHLFGLTSHLTFCLSCSSLAADGVVLHSY